MKYRKLYIILVISVLSCAAFACNKAGNVSGLKEGTKDAGNVSAGSNQTDNTKDAGNLSNSNFMSDNEQLNNMMENNEYGVSKEKKEIIPEDDEYVNVKDYIPDIFVELRYATDNNFTGSVIYDFDEAYLRYGTVKKLADAQRSVKEKGYSLKIWDAYRPFSAQERLWEVYPDGRYVANPKYGMQSHNLGGTVDITLVGCDGEVIPMPTDFDEFSKKADRNYSDIEDEEAVVNVMVLQNAMNEAGFSGYQEEWWDYSDTVQYEPVDYHIE